MRKTGGQGTHVDRCLATASSPPRHCNHHTTHKSEAADCVLIVPTDELPHLKATGEHAVPNLDGRGDIHHLHAELHSVITDRDET